MSIDSPASTGQLSAWLAGTDIEWLELRGPQTSLRLRRRNAAAIEWEAAPAPSQQPLAAVGRATVVKAPAVGVLLHRHPQRDAALAPVDTRVNAGQTLALLQIGTLLLPVPAPRDGIVTRHIAAVRAIVGYGDPVVELS
jgi:acetyl-CoA carboxylase biotin carboxyl carrier protein